MKIKQAEFWDRFSPKNISSKRAIQFTKRTVISVFRLLTLISIGYVIIYPLLHMVVTSIKSLSEFYNSARVWIPGSIDPGFTYPFAVKALNYWSGLKSTLIYEMIAALLEVCSCAIVAYGFARFKFRFKGVLMACLFITILIPETMVIIPRVVNYSKMDLFGILGLVNRLSGVDLRPNLIGTAAAFYIPSIFAIGLRSGLLTYIYIQFFKSLPYELEEAAWVDGAGPIRTFWSIALPSSSVVFVTVIVFAVVWHWNDTYLSSMYLNQNFPLAVNLDRIETTLQSFGFYTNTRPESMSILMAACVLFIAPVLVLYMILQRKFIESIDRVGITG